MDNRNRNARRSCSPRRFTPQEEEHLRSLTPRRKRHLIRDDPRVREFFEEEEGRRVECDPRSFIHDVAESSDESPEPEDIDFIDNTSGVSDSPSSGEHNETSSSSDHDDSGSDEEEESDSSSDGYEYTREPGTRAVATIHESDEEDEQVRAGQDEDNAPGDTGGRKRRADFGKSQQKKTKRGKREYSDSD